MHKRLGSWFLASTLLITACDMSSDASYSGGDGFGATPGGVKDMGLARELIAAGQVPPADALLVEAMFAEHDLGLSGAACERTLCLRSALGLATDHAGAERAWVQVGLSSTVDPATWVRPATTFILTVDVSGSMSWNYTSDSATPAHLAHDLLVALTPELRGVDRVAIVTYGSSVDVPLPLISGNRQAEILAAIEGLREDGSTNMEAGLRKAYEIGAQAVAEGESEDVRIVLFTDVQPNVGATEASEFENMVKSGADSGVSITVLALGAGLGPEVLRSMAHLRGANAFSLFELADVGTFMADNYPWFVTPIVHDLRLSVAPASGFAVDAKYGFPAGEGPVGLEVASVFLSKNKGALLFNLAPAAGIDFADVGAELRFDYVDRDGQAIREVAEVSYAGQARDERGQYFEQASVGRTTKLALLVSGMHEAAARYSSDRAAALVIMEKTHARFVADAAGDQSLAAEVELSADLLALMRNQAPQGSLYGL